MADESFMEYSDGNMFCNHLVRDSGDQIFYGSHSHSVYEVIYIKSGSITYGVMGREYTAGKGDLIVTRPFEEHYLKRDPSERYERYDLLFNEQSLGFLISDKLGECLPPINISGYRGIKQLFEKFDLYSRTLDGSVIGAVYMGLVREICANLILIVDGPSEAVVTDNKTVADAIEYIEKNLLEIKEVQQVADALFITKSHLHHLFSKNLSKSPKKYINEKRLLLVKKEIQDGARPSEIYSRYGFSDYSSFFRAYKKQFGRAPSSAIESVNIPVTPESTIVRDLDQYRRAVYPEGD